jgi:hypothetical protein
MADRVETRRSDGQKENGKLADRRSAGGAAGDHKAGDQSHMLSELDQEGGDDERRWAKPLGADALIAPFQPWFMYGHRSSQFRFRRKTAARSIFLEPI